RLNIQPGYFYHIDASQWTQNLETSKSIVQKCFPHSRIDIELSRFCLWI
ncbi:unnamed protein product, partial [Rotaria sp. Silwood1]